MLASQICLPEVVSPFRTTGPGFSGGQNSQVLYILVKFKHLKKEKQITEYWSLRILRPVYGQVIKPLYSGHSKYVSCLEQRREQFDGDTQQQNPEEVGAEGLENKTCGQIRKRLKCVVLAGMDQHHILLFNLEDCWLMLASNMGNILCKI